MIKVRNLNKKFQKVQALKDLSINVNTGSIYGLVGMNGSGKTTLLKHIAGVLKADSGEILVGEEEAYNNAEIKQDIGIVPDDLNFYSSYKPIDIANFYKSLYKDWDNDIFMSIINTFKLDLQTKMSKFSKGMVKQTVFALTLATKPDYLLLDEPIDGLDPIARKLIWKFIVDATSDRDMTTLVSSHNLKEMEGICDYIGILSNGTLLLERDLDELKADIHKVQVAFKEKIDPSIRYKGLNIVHSESRGSVDLLIVRNNEKVLDDFVLREKPVIFDHIPLSLEEIFIYELGGGVDEIESIIF